MDNITKYVCVSDSLDPAYNLSVEEHLMDICMDDQVYLYLWQNDRTVVIGKHQNPLKECNISKMKSDNITLIRRQSGGGAVYHDIGNLNFSFIAGKELYNEQKHFEVILMALRLFGIEGEVTGRNDMTVSGSKFSGNAFIHKKHASCHHGTLLISANIEELGRYLTPSKVKLDSKGVDSVRSRVVNLGSQNSEVNVESMERALVKAFNQSYTGTLKHLNIQQTAAIESSVKKYRTWQWTVAESPKATVSINKSFEWGCFAAELFVKDGRVDKALISSDALVDEPFGLLEGRLNGLKFKMDDISSLVEELFENPYIKNDLKQSFSDIVPL